MAIVSFGKRIIVILALVIIVIFHSCNQAYSRNNSQDGEGITVEPVISAPTPIEETPTTPIPPPSSQESSSYSSYYDYIQVQQLKEDVIFFKDVYNKTVYHKGENIPMRVGVINKKNEAISKITIDDEVPSPFKLKGNQFEILKNNKHYSKLSSKNGHIHINLDKINESNNISINYNISTNSTNDQYILNPAMMSANYGFLEGNISLQSLPIYIKIVDQKPIITQLMVSPNPVKRDCISGELVDGAGITLNASAEDLDKNDLKRCELWSSIDGLLNRTPNSTYDSLKMTDSNKYWYNQSIKKLSKGHQIITIKVYDQDLEYSEETIELDINDYFLNIFPLEYSWVLIIGVIGALLSVLFLVRNFRLCFVRFVVLISLICITFFYISYVYYRFIPILGYISLILLITTPACIIRSYSKDMLKLAWNGTGLIFCKLGCNKRSLSCFDKSLMANPSYQSARNNKRNALAKLRNSNEEVINED